MKSQPTAHTVTGSSSEMSGVGVGVLVGTGVTVGVSVGTGVSVGLGVSVGFGVGVFAGNGTAVGVFAGGGVAVGAGVGVELATAAGVAAISGVVDGSNTGAPADFGPPLQAEINTMIIRLSNCLVILFSPKICKED